MELTDFHRKEEKRESRHGPCLFIPGITPLRIFLILEIFLHQNYGRKTKHTYGMDLALREATVADVLDIGQRGTTFGGRSG